MKSTWFTNRTRYDFGRLLQEADYGKSHYQSFHAFLVLSSCSVQQATLSAAGVCSPAIEREYMQEVKQIKNPAKLSEAFALLADALAEKPEDFLGKYVSELGMNDKDFRGQCFTPTEVCEAMARISLHDTPKSNELLRLAEPACGCGAMIIATCRVLREQGYDSLGFCWQAVDIDWRMACSCFLQLTLLDVAAQVHHGNTLSNEIWRTYTTPRQLQLQVIEEEQRQMQRKIDALRSMLNGCDTISDTKEPSAAAECSKAGGQLMFAFEDS